jgi:TetR/AcrR family transcriptional regulator
MQKIQIRLPSEARQAEIVTATLALVATHSPAAITTSDIAQAVHVTQGAVFKHFASKDEIWLAVMGWIEANLLAALSTAEQQAASPLEALEGIFHAHIGFVASHPGVPRLIFHELQQPADSAIKQKVRGLLQAYKKMIVRLLKQAMARRDVTQDLDTDAAAALFIGSVQGLVMQSMLVGSSARMASQAKAVFPLYLRGIQEAR